MPFALLFRFDNYDEHRTHSGKNKGIGTNQMENQATHRCHYVIWTKPSHWATKIVFGPKESLVKIGPKQLLTKKCGQLQLDTCPTIHPLNDLQ